MEEGEKTMSYRIKIILDWEEKPASKDDIDYINELGEDIDFEVEEKKDANKC